ncbi:hypothetical protein KSS87_002731 [Heliosperma pusillum]|nr:hypothetical protein KSS87_002731 [Heliosperma pusillum]
MVCTILLGLILMMLMLFFLTVLLFLLRLMVFVVFDGNGSVLVNTAVIDLIFHAADVVNAAKFSFMVCTILPGLILMMLMLFFLTVLLFLLLLMLLFLSVPQ